jgi:hypothetical protein
LDRARERYQEQGHAAALAQTVQRINDDSGFAKLWSGLQRTDRAVLLLAARGVTDL